MKRKYKFFGGDVIKFKYSHGNMYFKILKDPENIFKCSYEPQLEKFMKTQLTTVGDGIK